MSTVPVAARLSATQMKDDFAKVRGEAGAVNAFLGKDAELKAKLGDWMATVDARLEQLGSAFETATAMFKKLAASYGEETEGESPVTVEAYFGVLATFMRDWARVCKEVEEQHNTEIRRQQQDAKKAFIGGKVADGKFADGLLAQMQNGEFFQSRLKKQAAGGADLQHAAADVASKTPIAALDAAVAGRPNPAIREKEKELALQGLRAEGDAPEPAAPEPAVATQPGATEPAASTAPAAAPAAATAPATEPAAATSPAASAVASPRLGTQSSKKSSGKRSK
eukprot:TRINITY_DN2895_c0_g1_i1.p1 TRINITY_DN2895_c0_g1~~TRINITY_DN2895_c0_g1_i1.p1  ORF type:complete len:310 (-),score=91.59 TRINITY_DN2895_c0_g1_i1:48-890(-)